MKQIPLTQNQFALVDDEDYEFLMQWKWYAWYSKITDSFYAARSEYVGKKTILMHRLIMNITDRNIRVDHENHNTLNNQRSNLRIATHSQNMANRRAHKNASSKYLGVSFHKGSNKWQANIRTKYIGLFEKEEDAAHAYDSSAIQLHGEFANLNFKNKIAV